LRTSYFTFLVHTLFVRAATNLCTRSLRCSALYAPTYPSSDPVAPGPGAPVPTREDGSTAVGTPEECCSWFCRWFCVEGSSSTGRTDLLPAWCDSRAAGEPCDDNRAVSCEEEEEEEEEEEPPIEPAKPG
jgi:hypothetical protein